MQNSLLVSPAFIVDNFGPPTPCLMKLESGHLSITTGSGPVLDVELDNLPKLEYFQDDDIIQFTKPDGGKLRVTFEDYLQAAEAGLNAEVVRLVPWVGDPISASMLKKNWKSLTLNTHRDLAHIWRDALQGQSDHLEVQKNDWKVIVWSSVFLLILIIGGAIWILHTYKKFG